jgi:hypothetical protein
MGGPPWCRRETIAGRRRAWRRITWRSGSLKRNSVWPPAHAQPSLNDLLCDSTRNGACPKVLKPISVCRLWLNEGDDATVEPLSDLGHERDNVVEQSVRRPVFFLAAIRVARIFSLLRATLAVWSYIQSLSPRQKRIR